MTATTVDLPDHEHTCRVSGGGYVVCVCGWAAAPGRGDPDRLAVQHIAEQCDEDTAPTWVERPGGRVCEPAPLGSV